MAYSQLRRTLVVKVGMDQIGNGIDARQGAVGFDPVKVLLGAPVSDTPIVGCWATEPVSTWDDQEGIVKLRDPAQWDLDGWRGMRLDWEGRHPHKQQWSNDLGPVSESAGTRTRSPPRRRRHLRASCRT